MNLIKHYSQKPMMTVLILLSLVFTSCASSSGDDGTPTDISLTVNKTALDYTKDAQIQTLAIKSNTGWTISGAADWCTVTATYNKIGDKDKIVQLNISVSANDTYDSRTCTLTVTAGTKTSSVVVTQTNKDGLILDASTVTAPAEGGTVEAPLKTTGDITVTSGESWIAYTQTRTLTSKTVVFNVSENATGSTRTGNVTLKLNDITQTLTISQPSVSINSTDSISPNSDGMSSNATALVSKIYAGWNLGNTLEATGNQYFDSQGNATSTSEDNDGLYTETSWGAPTTSKAIIDFVKSCGFNAVRIPVTWTNHITNTSTHEIDKNWLARVKAVVDYVVDNDMYAIINIHWDGGWLENSIKYVGYSDNVNVEQKALWKQIAVYFRDYDEHLIFAGCNEPNASTSSQMSTLLKYEQTFLNTVRGTGGRNAYRNLIIQGPNTDIDNTNSLMNTLPIDRLSNRMIVEVHYYNPWGFCGGDDFWFWGSHTVSGSSKNPTYGAVNEAQVSSMFDKMKTKFTDKSIPLILGEYGANRHSAGANQTESDASVAEYLYAVTKQAKAHGMAPFLWDIQASGNGMNIIDRSTLSVRYSDFLESLMKGAKEGTYPF